MMEVNEMAAVFYTIVTFALGFWYGYDAGKEGEVRRRMREAYMREHSGDRT